MGVLAAACQSRRPRLGPQPLQEGLARWPAHSLFRGQCCSASFRASITRSTFSRVAL